MLTNSLSRSDEEYVLEGDLVWITVDNVSVYIRNREGEVVVSLFPLNCEDQKPIINAVLSFEDAEAEIHKKQRQYA